MKSITVDILSTRAETFRVITLKLKVTETPRCTIARSRRPIDTNTRSYWNISFETMCPWQQQHADYAYRPRSPSARSIILFRRSRAYRISLGIQISLIKLIVSRVRERGILRRCRRSYRKLFFLPRQTALIWCTCHIVRARYSCVLFLPAADVIVCFIKIGGTKEHRRRGCLRIRNKNTRPDV